MLTALKVQINDAAQPPHAILLLAGAAANLSAPPAQVAFSVQRFHPTDPSLGPSGWQPREHLFTTQSVGMEGGDLVIGVGEDIYGHIDDYEVVKLSLPDLDVTGQGPWESAEAPLPEPSRPPSSAAAAVAGLGAAPATPPPEPPPALQAQSQSAAPAPAPEPEPPKADPPPERQRPSRAESAGRAVPWIELALALMLAGAGAGGAFYYYNYIDPAAPDGGGGSEQIAGADGASDPPADEIVDPVGSGDGDFGGGEAGGGDTVVAARGPGERFAQAQQDLQDANCEAARREFDALRGEGYGPALVAIADVVSAGGPPACQMIDDVDYDDALRLYQQACEEGVPGAREAYAAFVDRLTFTAADGGEIVAGMFLDRVSALGPAENACL